MPEPEPYVPENRERHSKHMRKLSVDSTDALPKAKVKFQVKRSKVQLPGHDEPIPAPPKSVPTSFFPGHSENPTASSSTFQYLRIRSEMMTIRRLIRMRQIQNLFLMKKM